MEQNKNCMMKKLSWVAYAVGAVGVGYFLWVHQAHVLQYLPYLFLLLCPLMHLFGGHGGHGGHEDHGGQCKHKKEE